MLQASGGGRWLKCQPRVHRPAWLEPALHRTWLQDELVLPSVITYTKCECVVRYINVSLESLWEKKKSEESIEEKTAMSFK